LLLANAGGLTYAGVHLAIAGEHDGVTHRARFRLDCGWGIAGLVPVVILGAAASQLHNLSLLWILSPLPSLSPLSLPSLPLLGNKNKLYFTGAGSESTALLRPKFSNVLPPT
jgi:hypothetical protein